MSHTSLLRDLAGVVGADHVVSDAGTLTRLSADYSLEPSTAAAAMAAPAGLEELVEVVATARRHGSVLAARGAAMSYTRAHTPTGTGTVLVDTRRLSRVLAIDERDMTVRVEAGCTWEELYLALAPRGLRTPFWGPLSGHSSTVGGAMSQNAAFLGSARYGSAVDAVLGLTVVLADGRVLGTGAHARVGPGLVERHFGPDLTGVFLADAGAMGIKAEVSMALVPAPARAAGAVFAARDIHQALAMMAALARPGLASDIYGFDAYYHRLLADQGLEAALAWPWTVNVVVEGPDADIVDAQLAFLRRQLPRDTPELDASAPLAMRADPFGSTRTIFQSQARAVHLPVHGVFAPSAADAAARELADFAAEHAAALASAGIRMWTMLVAVGQRVIIEPTLFFEGEYAAGGDDTRELALALRRELARRLARRGATHNQVGRYYPLEALIDPVSWDCLTAVKALLDPEQVMNPGALGLAGHALSGPQEPVESRVAPA